MTEERVLREIKRWEEQISSYEVNDFEKLYDEWLGHYFSKFPESVRERFFESIDQWFLYTYTFLQNTTTQTEAIERMIQIARTYDENIERIEDLRSLSIEKMTYLADQQVAKNRVYSFAQGGITGAGGFLFLAADMPLIVALNLRSIQLIGTSFGYNLNHPIEMIIALKVFHAGILPKRLQSAAWNDLKDLTDDFDSIMEDEAVLTDETWLDQPVRQLFKTLFIVSFRKKLFQGIPLISVGIGAAYNYKLARQLTDFAKRFYQYRFVHEQQSKS